MLNFIRFCQIVFQSAGIIYTTSSSVYEVYFVISRTYASVKLLQKITFNPLE